jgi:arylsulfatase A
MSVAAPSPRSGLRRRAIAPLAAGCLLGGVVPTMAAATASPTDSLTGTRPNIVFLYADDFHQGEMGFTGQQKLRTPRIDALASESMHIDTMYSCPTCSPSRACLMTGQYIGHTTQGNGNVGALPFRVGDTTIGVMMRDAGYATGYVGKWALSDNLPDAVKLAQQPWNQGFDYYAGNIYQGANGKGMKSYPEIDRDGSVTGEATSEPKVIQVSPIRYVDDVHADLAMKFIDKKAGGDKPFCLMVGFRAPHNPYDPPTLYDYEKENWGNAGPGSYADVTAYAATVTRLDENIGQILDKIAEKGIADKTLVIFTSDNGSVYSRRAFTQDGGVGFWASAGQWRGGKWDFLEGGVRVGALARWTGVIAPGSKTSVPVSQYETMATFADLAGIKAPAQANGSSWAPVLQGKGDPNRMVMVSTNFVQAGPYRAKVGAGGKIGSLINLAEHPRQEDGDEEKYNLLGTLPELESKIVAFAQPMLVRRAPPPDVGKPRRGGGDAEGEEGGETGEEGGEEAKGKKTRKAKGEE